MAESVTVVDPHPQSRGNDAVFGHGRVVSPNWASYARVRRSPEVAVNISATCS